MPPSLAMSILTRGNRAPAGRRSAICTRRSRKVRPSRYETVDALGNVHYDDNQVILKGPKAWSNLNTKDTNVWEGDYQMVVVRGAVKADLMKQRGENRYTILENGTLPPVCRVQIPGAWSG